MVQIIFLVQTLMVVQNLLINGSFEDVNDLTSRKESIIHPRYFKNWTYPTDGTPDIYRDVKAYNKFYIHNIEPLMDTCIEVQSGNYCAGLYLIDDYGLSPFYYNLFNSKNKVYADYELHEPIFDTNWTKITTYFKAFGNEEYITFGKFSIKNDEKIISVMKKISKSTQAITTKLKNENKLLYFQDKGICNCHTYIKDNYYFLDNISVEPLSISDSKIANLTCDNCIDNNPLTIYISNQVNFLIDKGYEGDMTFTVSAAIRKNEKITISLGLSNKIVIVGDTSAITNINYQFVYPVSKITTKNVTYSISELKEEEKTQLINEWNQLPENVTDFKGKVYTNFNKLTTTSNNKESEISSVQKAGDANYPISFITISGNWRSFGGFLLWK